MEIQELWYGGRPTHVITGFEECRRALSDTRLTSDPHLVGITDTPSHNMLLMDGQRHQVLRRLVGRALNAQAVSRIAPLLRGERDRRMSKIVAAGRGDLIADLVEPLVARAALASVVPARSVQDRVRPLLPATLAVLEPTVGTQAGHGTAALLRIAAALHRSARHDVPAGLFADLVNAEWRGLLGAGEKALTVPVVLHGGYENPLNALSLLVAYAALRPGEFRATARRTPAHMLDAVLCERAPVRRVARWAVVPIPVIGCDAGDAVWIELQTATRQANDTDTVDTARAAAGHLGFGHGTHQCPGSHLARLLAGVVTEALLDLPPEALEHADVRIRTTTITCGAPRAQIDLGARL